jgi:hypothetical protein
MSRSLLLVAVLGSMAGTLAVAENQRADPLKPWKQGVKLSTVLKDAECHSIHTYYVLSPESPDGRWVVLFTSTDPQGHKGEVVIVERATGRQTVLARNVTTEDAHRVAYQQWVSHGRRVVYQDLRDGEWVVAVVDLDSRKERILARGRQLGFGQASADIVPIYGPHWAPGDHRDLELVNVASGAIQKVLSADAVRKAYPEWVARTYGDRPISIYAAMLSPQLDRVVFKVASPASGGFQTKRDSDRNGLFCYDLRKGQFLWMHKNWGHPAWHPTGRSLINVGPVVIDAETGGITKLTGFTALRGEHPSFGPDGKLFATDTLLDGGEWAVLVGDPVTRAHQTIHRFNNSRGASSWRRSHPHPSFSPDGKRLYFNVSADRWTRLYVAEAGE